MSKRKRRIFEELQFECGICLEEHSASNAISVRTCGKHLFCKSSFKEYVDSKINVSETKIRCPAHKCKAYLRDDEVKYIVSPKAFKKYLRFKAMKESADYRECPKCSLGTTSGNDSNRDITCQSCRHQFCFLHENAHPIGMPEYCFNYIHREEMSQSESTIQKTTRKCPRLNCKYRIEKNGGCPVMQCKCGQNFVWDTNGNVLYGG